MEKEKIEVEISYLLRGTVLSYIEEEKFKQMLPEERTAWAQKQLQAFTPEKLINQTSNFTSKSSGLNLDETPKVTAVYAEAENWGVHISSDNHEQYYKQPTYFDCIGETGCHS